MVELIPHVWIMGRCLVQGRCSTALKVHGRPPYLGCMEYQLPTLLLMAAFPIGLAAKTKGPEPLSAQESDPVRLGCMKGTPPRAGVCGTVERAWL